MALTRRGTPRKSESGGEVALMAAAAKAAKSMRAAAVTFLPCRSRRSRASSDLWAGNRRERGGLLETINFKLAVSLQGN